MKRETQINRNKIADHFFLNGWVPNIEYFNKFGTFFFTDIGKENSDLTKGLSYGVYHLISSDKKYAVTINPCVLTIHSVERRYCKVISMKLADLTCQEDYVREGNIIFKLGTV